MKATTTALPVQDIQIHATVVGEGTPVIVIHGARTPVPSSASPDSAPTEDSGTLSDSDHVM
ncbi:hypothetical protein ACX80V_03745 [Arthrobacter sp. MDT3-24]